MSTWHEIPREEIEIDGEDINICLKGDKFGNNYCVVKKADILKLWDMAWISVKDRLPEVEDGADAVKVLVYYNCAISHTMKIGVTYFWKDSLSLSENGLPDGFELLGVTHWMPLPEPPK